MKRIFHLSARALKIILATLFFIILAVAIFLNSNYFDSFIKDQIVKRLSKAIDRTIGLDSAEFNPFLLDIRLKNFSIGNDPRGSKNPFFHGKEIYARVSWRYLLAGRVRISEVKLDHPVLNIEFYKGGGTNWPAIKKKPDNKKGGIEVNVSRLDCDGMEIYLDQRRLPLTFSVTDLETYAEYDKVQKNYYVTTNFKDGHLKITHFEVWKFDMKANYRIVSGRVNFERLFFLSPKSKFYMAGEMSNLRDPFFDFHFHSHISLDQAKKIFDLPPDMTGGGSFHAIYKGTFTKFHMLGNGAFRHITFYTLPIDSATFNLDMTENSLDVSQIKAEMFGGDYNGIFSIAPLKGHSIFKTSADFNNWDGRKLGQFVHMKDLVIPIKGSGKASLIWEENGFKDLKGTFAFKMVPDAPLQTDLAVEAENSNFDQKLYHNTFVLPVENETEFRIEGRQLRDLKSHLKTPYTDTNIDGTIDFSGAADLNVTSHSERIPEIDLLFHYLQAYFKNKSARDQDFWRVKGASDFTGKLDATVWDPFSPRLTGAILAHNAFFHGVHLTEVRANVMFQDRLIEVYDADLKSGDASSTVKAKFFLADKEKGTPDAMDLVGSLVNFPATEIAHAFLLELPISGSVNSTIELKGPMEELEGRAVFEATRGSMWGEKIDRATGTVLFFPDSLGLRDITAYMGTGKAEASGDLVYESDDYNVEFSAENVPIDHLNILQTTGFPMTGIGSAQGSGHGTLDHPELEGNVQIKNLVYKKELYGDVVSNLQMKEGWLRVETDGIARGIPSHAKAELHLDGNFPFTSTFDIDKFPLEILTRAYAPGTSSITGLVGGKFEMNGTLNPAHIDHLAGGLNTIELEMAGLKFTQARPLDVQMTDQVIRIKDSLLVGDHSSISITGDIFPKEDWRLDLNLNADAGLEILSTLNKDITASGISTAKISIGGTVTNPALTGVMEIKNGFFRHFSFPNSLTDISALLTFKNQIVTLQSLKASSSGGTLTAGGSATIHGYDLSTYRFDLFADKIRVNYPDGLRTTVNSELHLQSQKDAAYLVGDINVLQGVYVRSFEETPDLFGYAAVPTFGLPGAASSERPLQLNVRIHSDGNLFVRNNFANMESAGELNVIGTLDNPVLVGRMEVKEGTITFRDREYKISRGSLDFQNPYRTEVLMNFTAETRIREYNITLNFNGTFDRIYHDLTSDPPLPLDDIYALLGIGNTREAVQGVADVSALIAGQQISEFITSPITSPLERQFKKFFGLQRFQIDPTYVESTQVATARITVEKDISKDFSVTYSTNIFTAAEEIILLQYQLTGDVQVTASKDERARIGIDFLVTKTFE